MRKVVPLDPGVLGRAPEHVRRCLRWQLGPSARVADPAALKAAWVEEVTAEWGTCGQVVDVDGAVAGCVVYAPAAHLPGVAAYPTAPVSPDALVMASIHLDPAYAGRGLGRVLVQAMARDLLTRYDPAGPVRAVETIADTGRTAGGVTACAPPAGFCAAVGFSERRAHPRHPRLRLDLRACVPWRTEVEQALERLRAGVRTPVPARAPGAGRVPSATEPRDADATGLRPSSRRTAQAR